MAFRKRKTEDVALDKILGAYQANSPPTAARGSAVGTIRCWNCKRPNVFDARREPPRRCVWCRSLLT